MSHKIHLSCSARNGYRLEFSKSRDPSSLTVSLTEISFYSEDDEDDCIIEVDDAELTFVAERDGTNGVVVCFGGWVTAALSDEVLSGLEKADYSVDYLLEFEAEDEALESDVDYEFISNQNLVVRVE